jgi:hypothetical protein
LENIIETVYPSQNIEKNQLLKKEEMLQGTFERMRGKLKILKEEVENPNKSRQL